MLAATAPRGQIAVTFSTYASPSGLLMSKVAIQPVSALGESFSTTKPFSTPPVDVVAMAPPPSTFLPAGQLALTPPKNPEAVSAWVFSTIS